MTKLNLDLSNVQMTSDKQDVELIEELADMGVEIDEAHLLLTSFKNNSEDIMCELTKRGVFPLNILKRW